MSLESLNLSLGGDLRCLLVGLWPLAEEEIQALGVRCPPAQAGSQSPDFQVSFFLC